MGSDYAWLRCWHPAPATEADRDAVLDDAAAALEARGYAPTTGDGRGLVAGLDGRWVQLGDQADSTEYQGAFPPPAPAELAAALSRRGPAVRMVMSDDAVVHLELWRDGARVDRYGTMHLGWALFPDAEVDAWRGAPAAWADLLAPGAEVAALAAAWELTREPGGWKGRYAGAVLEATGEALGWDPELAQVGWSHDADGLYIPWDGFLEDEDRARLRPRARILRPPG